MLENERPDAPLYVFAYGSLMWRPGFAYRKRLRGAAAGYRRSFALTSIHHRGTEARPGLVLALVPDAQARCEGLIYEVAPEHRTDTLAYLRERELVTYAYHESLLDMDSEAGPLRALCYVMDPTHPQSRDNLSLNEQAEIIASAEGLSGSNRDYLTATLAHLHELGCNDPDIEALAARVAQICV